MIASEGSAALVRLAERLQAPVITTAEGKGAIDDRHPLALGALRLRNDPVAKSEPNFDVILGVGSRMAFPAWLDGQRVVQIDIDPEELGRNWDNTYGVAGDARTVMEQVDAKLADSIQMGSRPSMADEVVASAAASQGVRRCVPSRRSRCWRRCAPPCRRTASWCRA